MNKLYVLLIISLLTITGCTTIGQQITNHSGVLQIEQQNIPFNAQSSPSTVATLDNLAAVRVTSNPFYTRSTIVNEDYVVIKTNSAPKKHIPTNTVTVPPATNIIKTNSVQKISTNNVIVNVYTDSVNIKESSFLSDVYNYLFSE